MEIGQLDYPLSRLAVGSRPGATFVLPRNVAVLLSGIAQRCATKLSGQANLPWQIDLATLPDAVAFLDLLTSDTNGHKVKLPSSFRNLLVKILYRTARDLGGNVIYGNTTAS